MKDTTDGDYVMPFHNKCGLPVELCTCPDARVVYDQETDMFVDRGEEFE